MTKITTVYKVHVTTLYLTVQNECYTNEEKHPFYREYMPRGTVSYTALVVWFYVHPLAVHL